MSQVFQRFLLATERTEFDTGAERVALAMAKRCGRPLAVVMPLASNAEFESVAPEIAERGEREAAAKLALLRSGAQAEGVALDLRVRRGDEAFREIVDDARERAADLIVIRRRGRRSFLAQLLVGEMVGEVVAHAPCSVLVVPRDAAMWARRVLVAIEPGEPGASVLALATAVALECRLPMSVVCVADSSPDQRQTVESFIAEARRRVASAGVAVDAELLSGEPAAQILGAARRRSADLIVIGSRSGAQGGRARVGTVAQQVTGQSECAVLLGWPSQN